MNNYLLVAHGLRININNDFERSHFEVPEGFNFITFHKPGARLFNNLGNIIAEQLPNFTEPIINTFTINSTERRILLEEIENNMIKNHLINNLNKIIPSEELDVDVFGNVVNEYRDYLSKFIEIEIPDNIDLSNSKNLVDLEIDNIKNLLDFQIRVYLEGTKAPLMNISFDGGNDNFTGLFEVNNLPEYLFNKSEDFEVSKILGYSLIKDDFNRINGRAFSLDQSLIEIFNKHNKKGNIFIFSCGDYDRDLGRNSLLRQKSNEFQGIVKKYKIYYNSN